jgi:putative transposase
MTRHRDPATTPAIEQSSNEHKHQATQSALRVKGRFSKKQILNILREHAGGVSARELCRRYDISATSFYKWRAKYNHELTGQPNQPADGRLLSLMEESLRLRRLLGEALLENALLKEMLAKKGR